MSYNAQATFMQFDSQSPVDERHQKGLLDTRTGYLEPYGLANGTRLQDSEPHKHGPYADVVYIDNAEPWAEFTFFYKSIGTRA
jgi:hypothetical protein